MSTSNRPAVVDINDMDELEMHDVGPDGNTRNRRSTIPVIKGRNRKSTHDLGRSKLGRSYAKVKKTNEDIGLNHYWNSLIKVVEDKLGADATAYFSLVAWLSWMLIPSVIFILSFLLVPQMYYRFVVQTPPGYAINNNFTWHDFFTGEGWLENTELFEGYYTNTTIKPAYEMPIAYFFVIALCYIFFFLMFAKSYARAISERYVRRDQRRSDSHQQIASHIQRNIFCYWNFSICNSATAAVRRANILEDMKKFLVKRDEQELTSKQLIINIISHITITALIFGVSVGIFFAATSFKYSEFAGKFAVSIMTSVASVIVPPIVSMANLWEKYKSRNLSLFVPLFRNFLLQILLFFTFIFILFTRAVCFRNTLSNETFPLCQRLVKESEEDQLQCWETWFGQQIYRWQIVDLITVFLLSLVSLCLRRVFVPLGLWKAPIVNVEMMVMHLLLTQCFTWFGMFASPLLPLIFLIKLVLSFLWFRLLVTRCCRPSNAPWKSKYAMTFFHVTIALAFILSVIFMITAVVVLKPSKTCGPFVKFKDVFDIFKYIRQGDAAITGSDIWLILSFFNSFGFNVFLTLFLIVLLLLMRRTAQAKDENLKLFRNTIQSLAKDKVYYKKEIKKCENENPYYMRSTINRPSDSIRRTPSGTSIRSEDVAIVTIDPASPMRLSGRKEEGEITPSESIENSVVHQADNNAFVPGDPSVNDPSENGDRLSPASSELSLRTSDVPAFPSENLAFDYGPDDDDHLIRKDSDDSSKGIDSPFFANGHTVDPMDSPEVPPPDY